MTSNTIPTLPDKYVPWDFDTWCVMGRPLDCVVLIPYLTYADFEERKVINIQDMTTSAVIAKYMIALKVEYSGYFLKNSGFINLPTWLHLRLVFIK